MRSIAIQRTLLVTILAAHVVLLIGVARRNSACYDEGPHISAGLAYWKWGETSIYNLSPPPPRMWAALPAYLAHPDIPPAKPRHDDPPTSRHFIYFQIFQASNVARVADFVRWGRYMQIPISVLLALGIFAAGRSIYGNASGLVACAVYCFSPTVLAHAATVGTDLWAAGLIFGATIAWARFMQKPSNGRAMLAATVIALAHMTKFSAVILWPVVILIAGMEIVGRRRSIKECSLGLLLSVVLSYVAINGSYGFRLFGRPLDRFEFQSSSMSWLAKKFPASTPVPFAADLVEGFDAQKYELESKYAASLFGRAYVGSDWRYYPWLVATKSTVGGLILLSIASVSLVMEPPTREEAPLIVLLLTTLIVLLFGSDINIGIRYLLPEYAPAAVLVARAMKLPRVRVLFIVALTLAVGESIIAMPRLHSFVNLAASHWRSLVPDQDAGQSLTDLRKWEDETGNRASLLYFGTVDPVAYGVRATPANSRSPEDFVAISKAHLQGVPGRINEGFIFVRTWPQIARATPVADLGGILIYHRADVGSADGSPWFVPVASWQEAAHEPEMLHVEGVQGMN